MRVSFRIHYDRRLGLATLLVVALLGSLAWEQREAVASNTHSPLATSSGMRQYYLTQLTYNGANADTVCAPGYHMAALWEIMEPSHLKYNTALGFTRQDTGQGPPTIFSGWVRTGYGSSGSSTAGQGNCYNWSSSSGGDYGTYAWLPYDWIAGVKNLHVWAVGTLTCSSAPRVWCVEDHIIYLPVIMRSY